MHAHRGSRQDGLPVFGDRPFHSAALCSEAPTCTEIENAQATRG
jgi:hypothetical protein